MFSFKLKLKNKEPKRTIVSNPKILEVNLIKEEASDNFAWGKNLVTSLIVFFIAIVLVGEIYYGLDWWQNQEMAKTKVTETEVSKLNKEISVLNNTADNALKYKEKVVVLGELLGEHIYWSNFLNWLEKNTLSSVQYDQLSGNTSGIYSFMATAKTYADVSWQTKAFLNDPLTKKASVEMANLPSSKDEKKKQVSFILNLEVNPSIFKK